MTSSQYLRAFVRFWWAVVLCAAIGTGLGLATASAARPSYKASVALAMAVTKAVPRTTPDYVNANSLAQTRALSDAAAADEGGLLAQALAAEDPTRGSTSQIARRLSVTVPTSSAVLVVTAEGHDEKSTRALAVDAAEATRRIVSSLEDQASSDRALLRARILDDSLTESNEAAAPAWRNTLLTGLAGLLVGLALAVGLARLRPRLRDPSVASELAGAPVLGALPRRTPGSARYAQALAEARTSIFFLRRPEEGSLIVALATPLPDGGLNELAQDLAADMASTGSRVLLVDANLRETGDARTPGLADYLTASSPLRGLVSTDARGFDLMSAGRAVIDPANLLHHERFTALMTSAADRYDHLLVLTPPTSAGTGAPAVAARCSATVVVVGDRTRARYLRECLRVLRTGAAPVKGVVITRGLRPGKGSRSAS